jgi:hypothetical protein
MEVIKLTDTVILLIGDSSVFLGVVIASFIKIILRSFLQQGCVNCKMLFKKSP